MWEEFLTWKRGKDNKIEIRILGGIVMMCDKIVYLLRKICMLKERKNKKVREIFGINLYL